MDSIENIKIGKYRHYKGKEYEVLGTGKNRETLEDIVIYRALYNSEQFGNRALWTQSIARFLEPVTIEGRAIPRFEYLG